MGASEPVCAIDLGTNSALALVARRSADGGLEEVDGLVRMPRLGEGLAKTGVIGRAGASRAREVLVEFRARCDELGVERVRVVGTAVFRRASNGADVARTLAEAIGRPVEVLTEDEEAELGYRAVLADGARGDTVVVDVGGGSTEVVARGGTLRRSLPIGGVVLTEHFLAERADERGFDALGARVRDVVSELPAGLGDAGEDGEPPDVVALGGTGSNVACLALGLERFDHRRAEGVAIEPRATWAEARRLAALSIAERRALPIEPERASILPAGMACLALVLERIGARSARVSNRGLRFEVARRMLAGT